MKHFKMLRFSGILHKHFLEIGTFVPIDITALIEMNFSYFYDNLFDKRKFNAFSCI